jgi:hypothetical protein
MKTAIYIQDGITQLVLTPETNWETTALNEFQPDKPPPTVLRGDFYNCQGGFFRYGNPLSNNCLILVQSPSPIPPHGQETS